MKVRLGLMIGLLLIAAPAFAQRITIDYDHDFDFGVVKTFQYAETKDTSSTNELMHKRIKEAIVRELTEGGLQQVDSGPDLFVTYHITTQDYTTFSTTGYGYGGYGRGYYGWGGSMGSSTTTASTYTEGTLIIDAYNPSDKQMIWRGTGTVGVKAKPEKQIQQIDKILTKMGAKWDKILAQQGK